MGMTFEQAKQMIEDISEDQVLDRLDTAMYALVKLKEKYDNTITVEMSQAQKDTLMSYKESEETFDVAAYTIVQEYFIGLDDVRVYSARRDWTMGLTEKDLMMAWLNPELIVVKEND